MAMRRAEDQEALALLGAAPIHWPFPDAIYRHDAAGHPLCQSREDLFRPPRPEEVIWVERVRDALNALQWEAGDMLLAPMALGGHVDHRIVRIAVEGGHYPGVIWGLYEDFPYAEREAPVGPIGWQPYPVPLAEEDLELKARAMQVYRSQWPIFFADADEIRRRVRAYAFRFDEDAPVECFWFPPFRS